MSRTVIVEQTKDRNGRPAWAIFINGIRMGRVEWFPLGQQYGFAVNAAWNIESGSLREIAEFIDKQNGRRA